MKGRGKKILGGAFAADAAAGALIVVFFWSISLLYWWLILNAIIITLALLVSRLLLSRRRRMKSGQSSFSKEFLTLRGEKVKSGGEKAIADYFYQNNIKYEYEAVARANNGRIISRPDFYLPKFEVFIEYWGMVNADDKHKRDEYVKGMKWKTARYRENGIKVISLYPDNIRDLDWTFKSRLRDATGIDLNKK